MKNAKKLLGMVLSLCLVLSLLAGFAAAAAGEKNLLVGAGDWYYAATGENKPVTQAEGITIPLDHGEANANYQIHTPVLSVEPNTSYTLAFEYSLPAAQLEYVINACSAEGEIGGSVVSWTKLDVTSEKYVNTAVSFTTGDAVTYMKVRFVTTNRGNTGSATVRYVSVVKEEFKATNGSFEAVDGEGNVIGAAGTVVTDSDATPVFDGERMMVATKGSPVTLDLALSETSENAKLRGYIKAVDFANNSATLVVKTAGGAVLAEKSMNMVSDDGIWDIAADTWEYVRMSGLPYRSGMELVITVEGDGSGKLYADGFTFEKDNNLVPNATFDSAISSWTLTNYNESSSSQGVETLEGVTKNDGDCPDGGNYLYIDKGISFKADGTPQKGEFVTLRPREFMDVNAGEKYRVSVWYKSNTGLRIMFETPTSTTAEGYWNKANYYEDGSGNGKSLGEMMMVDARTTAGAWRNLAITITIPNGVTKCRINLRAVNTGMQHSTVTDESGTTTYPESGTVSSVALNMPVIEKLEESEIGFYKPTLDEGNILVKSLEWYAKPFVNVLGETIDTATGYTENFNAVHITTDPKVTSDDIVILAAYNTDAEGKKQLVSISIGNPAESPEAPASTSGHLKEKDGDFVDGVNYPTISADASAFDSNANEIRAFAWDDVSGLRPAGNYATLTK